MGPSDLRPCPQTLDSKQALHMKLSEIQHAWEFYLHHYPEGSTLAVVPTLISPIQVSETPANPMLRLSGPFCLGGSDLQTGLDWLQVTCLGFLPKSSQELLEANVSQDWGKIQAAASAIKSGRLAAVELWEGPSFEEFLGCAWAFQALLNAGVPIEHLRLINCLSPPGTPVRALLECTTEQMVALWTNPELRDSPDEWLASAWEGLRGSTCLGPAWTQGRIAQRHHWTADSALCPWQEVILDTSHMRLGREDLLAQAGLSILEKGLSGPRLLLEYPEATLFALIELGSIKMDGGICEFVGEPSSDSAGLSPLCLMNLS